MFNNPEIQKQIIETIDILENLENLMDTAPSPAIEEIIQQAWVKIRSTLPDDFQQATRLDASAEGMRQYLRVQAFFANPTENSISKEDLETYYKNLSEPVDEDEADFYFPD
ncbi:No_hits_found [Rivularia sp. IAM M-261]|nr:No_hits_found [Rivularia sp. IAM M-261]